MPLKTCTTCNEAKPPEKFSFKVGHDSRRIYKYDPRQDTCKSCNKKVMIEKTTAKGGVIGSAAWGYNPKFTSDYNGQVYEDVQFK